MASTCSSLVNGWYTTFRCRVPLSFLSFTLSESSDCNKFRVISVGLSGSRLFTASLATPIFLSC
uniref:Uncharacterized protein n=1 Tax=Arundo donax TaxID=35708 RepID=A0A0A8YC43_ARUDO